MDNQLRINFLVGVTFIITIAVLVYLFQFFRNTFDTHKTLKVTFSDVLGMKAGEEVQMAGIKIGQVDAIRLTDNNRAELTIGLKQPYEIPQGARFAIRSGVLGNTRRLVVIPPEADAPPIPAGTTVEGESAQVLDQTLEDSRKLIQQGQELVGTLNQLLGDPERQRDLDRLLDSTANITQKLDRNLDRTLENIISITQNLNTVTARLPQLTQQVDVLLTDLRSAARSGQRIATGTERITVTAEGLAGDARQLTRDLNATLNENREGLKELVASADEAASAVAGLTGEVKNLVADPKLRENLVTTTDNVEATTANLVSITARLDTATESLSRLAVDPTLSSDIKATVTNLRETTDSLRNILDRIEQIRLPGEPRRPTPTGGTAPGTPPPFFSTTSLLEPGLVFDSLYDTTLGRFRADANYTLIANRRGTFYRLGLYDTGETNRLNLQLGQANRLPAGFAYRYGIVNGSLGLGLDVRTGPLDFRFDFFDPNEFTTNARAKAYLNRDASLFFGMDSLGQENRATFGLQLRR